MQKNIRRMHLKSLVPVVLFVLVLMGCAPEIQPEQKAIGMEDIVVTSINYYTFDLTVVNQWGQA